MKSENNEVKLKGGQLLVFLNDSRTTAKNLLTGWYKTKAEKLLTRHFLKNMEIFNRFDVAAPTLTIKRMRKRWGSLTPSKKLILNPELIKAPVKCIDYVIIHELCHLIHPHHGKEFYLLLESIMPDWKMWKDRLERISA